MRPSLSELADRALDEVRRLKVGYADVRAVQEDAESVDVRDDRVQAMSRDSTRGVGIRVLVDGAWGFAATSDVETVSVRATAALAVDIAKASATLRGGGRIRLDDTPPASGTYTTPHLRDPFEVPLTEKAAHLLAAVAAAREAAGITYVEASTDAWRKQTSFRSTEGSRIEQTVLQVGAGLTAWAIGDGEVQTRSYPNSFRGQYVTGGWEQVVALDLAGHALVTAREAVALLTAPELPYREDATVVLESSQLALQVHESVGHPLELDRILGMERAFAGTSFVEPDDRGRLQYAAPIVSITADATTPGAMGTFGWDDEGVPAGSNDLIRDGLLVGFLTNRETAADLGLRSNGTARAESWGTIPLIRMNNVSLEPREGDRASIIADTADGVLLLTNRSWSIDDRRDNFQFGTEAAYEIVNGQLGRLYRNGGYAGRCVDFWRSCDALGGASDWTAWGVPNCGKGQPGQSARVGHGAPTGRFRATVGIR
ncbi:TldD/PmbA family protein [Acidothermaceae bacterium B102]|nr:TldD/PmbA family protein [Acidothermaceae bacterium B102]